MCESIINPLNVCGNIIFDFVLPTDRADPAPASGIGKVLNISANEQVIRDGRVDMRLVNAIAFDPYTHGYYKVTDRVGEAFHDGLRLKKET